jgi:phage protein
VFDFPLLVLLYVYLEYNIVERKNKIIDEKNFIYRLTTKKNSFIIQNMMKKTSSNSRFFFLERSELIMLLTIEHAKKVRRKRGELQLGKVQLAKKLKITPPTLAKIEAGNYDAPKRIYESVMEWLLEDY